MIKLFERLKGWLFRLLSLDTASPAEPRARGVVFVDGDELPVVLPEHDLAVAREGDVLWSAGLKCPCGCGRRLEVMLLDGVKPRWDLTVDEQGLPSLRPSIWVANGCRSHFWLRNGQVEWCEEELSDATALD